MNAFEGRELICKKDSKVKIHISTRELTVNVVVADNIIDGVEVILGMDVIDTLGGLAVSRNTVKFVELREDVLPTYSLLSVKLTVL